MLFTGRAGLDSVADRDYRRRSSCLVRLKIRPAADIDGARWIACYNKTRHGSNDASAHLRWMWKREKQK